MLVVDQEICDRPVKSPAHNGLRHVMSTLQNPSSDSREGQLDARQPQVKNVNFIPTLLKSAYHIQMASTGKRGLETKVISVPCKRFHFFEHQPPRAERRGFRRKGRQSLSDQVRIYKVWTVRILWQKFSCKRSLAGAIRPRDNVGVRAHQNSAAYLQLPPFARKVRLLSLSRDLEFVAPSCLAPSKGHPCRLFSVPSDLHPIPLAAILRLSNHL